MADEHHGGFVAYYRVSTAQQGKSGLGIEAQQGAVKNYLNGGRWNLVAEFTETESGKRRDRPELEKALAAARLHRVPLIVAKVLASASTASTDDAAPTVGVARKGRPGVHLRRLRYMRQFQRERRLQTRFRPMTATRIPAWPPAGATHRPSAVRSSHRMQSHASSVRDAPP
jgi:hypothetical protein